MRAGVLSLVEMAMPSGKPIFVHILLYVSILKDSFGWILNWYPGSSRPSCRLPATGRKLLISFSNQPPYPSLVSAVPIPRVGPRHAPVF